MILKNCYHNYGISNQVPDAAIALCFAFILLTLASLYVLYGHVLVKFYRQKNNMERARKAGYGASVTQRKKCVCFLNEFV